MNGNELPKEFLEALPIDTRAYLVLLSPYDPYNEVACVEHGASPSEN